MVDNDGNIKGGKNILVVGGSNGIGLAIALVLSKRGKVTIIDKQNPDIELGSTIEFVKFDLLSEDYTIFDKFTDIDTLVITAGFGKLSLFENLSEEYVIEQITVNTIAPIRIIKRFYNKIKSKNDFYCAVMVSIAGFMSSPLFSTYGASKAALKIFIESVNVELLKSGTSNCILNVSPGSLKGTRFNHGENDFSLTLPIAEEIIQRMIHKEDLWIPQYDEIFKEVLNRYHSDFRKEGLHSYEYKTKSDRMK